MPTVQELLDWVVTTNLQTYFDIKCSDACLDEVAKLVNSYPLDLTGRLTLGVWTQAGVERLEAQAPRVPRSIIQSAAPPNPSNWNVRNFNTNYGTVDQDFVDAAHANNQTVYSWTVNTEAVMRQMLNAGVDGVVTDYPDVFVNVRDGKRRA